MLRLVDIKNWLVKLDVKTVAEINKMSIMELHNLKVKELFSKGYVVADHFYIGKLDNKKQKSIGVYQLQTTNPNIAVSGLKNTKCKEKTVSILIHWNNNADETEVKALELYYKFMNARNFYITNNILVNYIDLLVPEPIDVGTDSSNIYERVIQARFYYKEVD